jgi:hypothetical protein
MPEKEENEKAQRFQDLATKILMPMDMVINGLHRRDNVRTLYFALADSRERLIQFLNIKKIDSFVAINLQMNQTLNKITQIDQDSPLTESESLKLIIMVSDWRFQIYEAVREMTHGGF